MLWLVLLPFRLLFFAVFGLLALPFVLLLLPFALLVWIPFLLLKFTLRLALGLLLIPLMLVGGLLGVVLFGVAAVAALVPLLPIAFVVVLLWMVMRRPMPVSSM
jgi:hypothetical protein